MVFHLTLIFYPHRTGMRSQMLYTNGSFEICQERMFVKQRRKDSSSIYLLPKKIFMLKQKSSNLYKICCNSAKKFLRNYLCTLHWHAFTNALHKQLIWNLPRANVCEAVLKRQLKHLLAAEKNIYPQAKIVKSLHDKFLRNYLCTLHRHAFTNALHKRAIWNLPRANVCEAASNTQLKHLLAVKKNIYVQAKIIKSLHYRF